MSAPGEAAPATLSAEWQAMADRTGRPFADGGAYASDEFADWDGCVAVLHGYGFTLHGAERFLRSKHMRWCADESSEGYGGATVAELTAYLGPDSSQWWSDFDMAPELVTASGEAAGPDAAADVSASLAEASAAERECDRMRDRVNIMVADGGQCRADIIDAIERIREDRDAAIVRAEKAEAERDAERAYRVAFHSMIANARGDVSAIKAPDARAVREAEARLRALGIEP